MMEQAPKPFRPNVGICLFDARGLVFAGRSRSSGPEIVTQGHEWQMPQGGIEPDEEIVAAARRELHEETGIRNVSLLAVTQEWWSYDFPPYHGPAHKLCAFRGQRQKWVAFRFTGALSEIDISRANGLEPPEFSQWDFVPLAALPGMVVPFKRNVYGLVATAFADFASGVI